ncbi:MAG: helix-turn-helix transcriptional regulator [Clostridia bacterium]|nr:helix-turn-helix transcriptional regulator [Clostridia bacterium]
MKTYDVEDANLDVYKNGICIFRQDTPPLGVGAFAHIHSAIEIIYTTHGTLNVDIDDSKYNVFAGDVVLFRSNAIHHIVAGDESLNRYYVLKIRPEIIHDLACAEMQNAYALSFAVNHMSSKSLWTKEDINKNARWIKQGFDMLIEQFNSKIDCDDIAAKLGAGLVLYGMLRTGATGSVADYSGGGEAASAVYRVMSYINRNYSEDITEQHMCTLAGMSYSYFSRSFKAITGKTFKEYVNITRVNRAERLLATTDKTVTEICTECGYNNVAYFIKVFKKYKSMPPMAYKRKERYYDDKKSPKIRYGRYK